MSLTVKATYENGVLKPAQPLPLKEHQTVEVTVYTEPSRARQTAGLLGWTGSVEDADRFAMDPELDPQEEP